MALVLLCTLILSLYAPASAWNPADYTAFISEQISGENIIKVSTYSTWLGKDNPDNVWPIATDDESDGGAWAATVTAYNESEDSLGTIDVPASAGGMVDYSAYVSDGIKYIRVVQGSGADSGFIEVTVYNIDTAAPTWESEAALTATPSGSSVVLSWPAASNDVEVTGYQVYQGET
ncbi:MAG: hypothetical protein ACOX7O_09385, partial [Oscillospiraceae bacterium]